MADKGFTHFAKVVDIGDGGVVKLAIHRAEACEGCHARRHCTMGDEQRAAGERTMTIRSDIADRLTIGESVEVAITYRVGVIAVAMAYITPLVAFIITIFALIMAGVEEGIAALCAFGVTAIYYIILYLARGRFERVVDFRIKQRGSV